MFYFANVKLLQLSTVYLVNQVCYRKNGHNEIDEPMFTQPRMYKAISKHPHVVDQYSDKLIKEGAITDQEYQVSYPLHVRHMFLCEGLRS